MDGGSVAGVANDDKEFTRLVWQYQMELGDIRRATWKGYLLLGAAALLGVIAFNRGGYSIYPPFYGAVAVFVPAFVIAWKIRRRLLDTARRRWEAAGATAFRAGLPLLGQARKDQILTAADHWFATKEKKRPGETDAEYGQSVRDAKKFLRRALFNSASMDDAEAAESIERLLTWLQHIGRIDLVSGITVWDAWLRAYRTVAEPAAGAVMQREDMVRQLAVKAGFTYHQTGKFIDSLAESLWMNEKNRAGHFPEVQDGAREANRQGWERWLAKTPRNVLHRESDGLEEFIVFDLEEHVVDGDDSIELAVLFKDPALELPPLVYRYGRVEPPPAWGQPQQELDAGFRSIFTDSLTASFEKMGMEGGTIEGRDAVLLFIWPGLRQPNDALARYLKARKVYERLRERRKT